MDEETTNLNETDVTEAPVEETVQETPVEETEVQEVDETVEGPVEEVQEVEEEADEYQAPQYPTFTPNIDFSQLPTTEDGLLDPNALASTITEQIAQAQAAAVQEAQARFQEERQEERLWNKAIEKYPELKTDKELRELVQNTRLGSLAQTNKFPTPAQVAETLFKRMGSAEAKGAKQATESVKIQKSAYVETSQVKSDDGATKRQQLEQQIVSPDPTVRTKATNELLKSMLFGEN